MNPVATFLEDVYQRYRQAVPEGAPADYIPELAKVDADKLGIVVTFADGHMYSYGDVNDKFTIQSISKAFVYGMALELHGVEKVLESISVEPSGEAFNSISLYPEDGRPFNPMINAGAIACTSLLWKKYGAATFGKILRSFGEFANNDLDIDESVYTSEAKTGHRNRAIAHLLRNFDIIESDVDAPLDCYFKQCSISVTCQELAMMGATLANNGINPKTSKPVIDDTVIAKMLSVMSTCGMYDYSGEWVYSVGMPAKSGVGGGVLAVLPGQLAIAVYSPRLDSRGNSVRGIQLCREIADHFSLHMFRTHCLTRQVIRRQSSMREIRSRYRRSAAVEGLLSRYGNEVQVIELQGDLVFATCEVVMRRIQEQWEEMHHIIFDCKRCNFIDKAALLLFENLWTLAKSDGKRVALVNYSALWDSLNLPAERTLHPLFSFSSLNAALLSSEENLLNRYGRHLTAVTDASLAEQSLLEDLSTEELDKFIVHLHEAHFSAGAEIIEEGESARSLFFIRSGEVVVFVQNELGEDVSLARLTPGYSFGEMAMIESQPRSATIRAETDVDCWVLPFKTYYQLEELGLGSVKTLMLRNLARFLSERLRKANSEIRSFS